MSGEWRDPAIRELWEETGRKLREPAEPLPRAARREELVDAAREEIAATAWSPAPRVELESDLAGELRGIREELQAIRGILERSELAR